VQTTGSGAGSRAVDPSAPATPGSSSGVGGKGRPTPKRREAQRRRTGPPEKPPQNRKEAYRRQRAKAATARGPARDRVSVREGLARGDERYLTARDRGPVRRFVRDVVDARRNAAGLFLPAAFVYFLGLVIPWAPVQLAAVSVWFVAIVALIGDSFLLTRLVKRRVAERFPDDPNRGHGLYAITRSTMLRRWRLPRPQVQRGEQV